jgi:cytochrome P450
VSSAAARHEPNGSARQGAGARPREQRTVSSPCLADERACVAPAVCLPGFLEDPYPTYEAWRESAPLLWCEEFLGGAWVVTRHADVTAVLRDPRFSARRTGGWPGPAGADALQRRRFRQLFSRALLFLDDPDHARVRGALQTAFRPSTVRELTGFVEQAAVAMCDGLDRDEDADFMARVARPLPARVIARWMGMEDVEPGVFMAWSESLAVFIGAMQPSLEQTREAEKSLLAMAASLEPILARRRAALGDDLISALIRAEIDGGLHAGPELLAQCAMLLFAGYETSRNLLGNGLHALLRHPSQWQRLQKEPSLLPGAVRELLRFDPAVQYTARRVSIDLMLHGRWLRRGDAVVACIAAANRDPRVFDRPDELDIGRRGASSLSFGTGAHACIGAALAQVEAQAVLRTLLRRYPSLELTDAPAHWNANAVYRGLRSLPLRRPLTPGR